MRIKLMPTIKAKVQLSIQFSLILELILELFCQLLRYLIVFFSFSNYSFKHLHSLIGIFSLITLILSAIFII